MQAPLKDSFPTSLTPSWERPPFLLLLLFAPAEARGFTKLPHSHAKEQPRPQRPGALSSRRGCAFGRADNNPPGGARGCRGKAPGAGRDGGSGLGPEPGIFGAGGCGAGGARQTAGPGGAGRTGRAEPAAHLSAPRAGGAAARLSRGPAAGLAGRSQMSDTFKGWKQSIFQSDHLKHLGNYTLKISVNNSQVIAPPGSTVPMSPFPHRPQPHGEGTGPACRHWGRAWWASKARESGGAPCDGRWEKSSLLVALSRRLRIGQSKQAGGEERAGGGETRLFVKKFYFHI